jgi:hypothetical protein
MSELLSPSVLAFFFIIKTLEDNLVLWLFLSHELIRVAIQKLFIQDILILSAYHSSVVFFWGGGDIRGVGFYVTKGSL